MIAQNIHSTPLPDSEGQPAPSSTPPIRRKRGRPAGRAGKAPTFAPQVEARKIRGITITICLIHAIIWVMVAINLIKAIK